MSVDPFAALYGVVTSCRNTLYDTGILSVYRPKMPVISVGNVTAGGNGKTPLCIHIVKLLNELGVRPVILSRGYGGTLRGPYLIKGSENHREVGDEPLLLAKRARCPVMIARDRVAGAQEIERANLGQVIVLDDGFQHRRLARDLDLMCIYTGSDAAVASFVQGRLLPFGRFRESRDRAVNRAGAFILSQRGPKAQRQYPDEFHQLLPSDKPVFRSHLEKIRIAALRNGTTLKPCSIYALSALASPDGFFSTLSAIGFDVKARLTFPDHYEFPAVRMRRILDDYPDLPIVCSEKDAIKIGSEFAQRLYVAEAITVVEPQAEFRALLEGLVQRQVEK